MTTADKLRADIDAGRTRDKVSGSDPAAAPLGTDEEAAGTTVPPQAVAIARAQEVDGPVRTNEDGGVLPYLTAIGVVSIVLAVGVFVAVR